MLSGPVLFLIILGIFKLLIGLKEKIYPIVVQLIIKYNEFFLKVCFIDDLICFERRFNKCKSPITLDIGEDVLLHQIYKHFPIIPVYWEIETKFMVPYDCTISVKNHDVKEYKVISSNETCKFDPLLYEDDFRKLELINDNLLILKHLVIIN
ncbi:hypothetical protein RFI_28699 [Reticulomyxa filosa]|uniref:Uncharacterized protein n=1 Tax=Reticulomyxa filosa TaxID=46433 RepID=X6M3Y2_RETFI|nr:hypothetical protein RFI_28699 [Reticulomyxa filosa]|eukprot:ETO08688.1 hypothetical protein RFI_28699 [Reticulomyxa filosa]